MKNISLMLVVVFLSSCASIYKPPTDMIGTAKISFEANSARSYTATLYIIRPYRNTKSCTFNGEIVAFINGGIPIAGSTENTVNVPFKVEGKSFFCVEIWRGQRACSKILAFEPTISNSYKVVANWEEYYCDMKVLNLTTGDVVAHDEKSF